jgi:hypothetical protein
VLKFFISQALFQSAHHLYEKREGSGSVHLTDEFGSGRPKNADLRHCLEPCVVVPDDPALLPVLVGEETPELGVENIAAHVCDGHNVALLEKLALRKKDKNENNKWLTF